MTYGISRSVFLRVLGACLAVGFFALWQQAPGLIGSGGITPLSEIMASWEAVHGGAGFWHAPSLFWLSSADGFIASVAIAGLLAGVSLTIGVAPRACCVVGYVAWLSFRAIEGGPVRWFNYPFDDLQTEVVFVGILVAPANLRLWRADPRMPTWVRILVLWLLFRLMFGPGATKVLYHAPWRELTAVSDFLLTMPHPTAAAAWVHDLSPPWIQAMSLFTLGCELVCPFLFLVPGRTRRIAAAVSIALMVGIQLVCNIRGFNLLTIGLLLLLWDDQSLRQLVFWRRRAAPISELPATPRPAWWQRAAIAAVMMLAIGASIGPFVHQFGGSLANWSVAAGRVAAAIEPFKVSSCYTMFCIMPTERHVFVVQGSQDGESWHDYELPGPPAHVDRAPGFFAPYHDYLGFKLWFAAFCPPQQDGWMRALQQRLLADAPAVKRLFAEVPFDGAPPRWVRVTWFRYRYASPAERAAGVHWQRESVAERVAPARRSQ